MKVLFTSKMKFLNAPKTPKKVKRVLMVCKHNRFRSKVAEALFNKVVRKKKIKNLVAFSRGENLDLKRMYVAPNVRKALRKFGVYKVDNLPRKLTKKDVKLADLIIVTANDVKLKSSLVKGRKVIYWTVKDTSQRDYVGILKRVGIIKGKVGWLVGELE